MPSRLLPQWLCVELLQSCCGNNREDILFSRLQIYCTHLASVRYWALSVCFVDHLRPLIYVYICIYIYIYIYTYIYIYIIHVLLSRCVNELVFKIYLKHILFCKCFAAIFEMFCKCFAASNFTIPFSQHFTVQPLIKMIS